MGGVCLSTTLRRKPACIHIEEAKGGCFGAGGWLTLDEAGSFRKRCVMRVGYLVGLLVMVVLCGGGLAAPPRADCPPLGPAHDPLIVPPCPSRADSPPHPQAWLLRASGFPRAASPPRSRPRKRPRPAPLPPVRRTLLHASTDRTRRPWRASSTGSHGRFGARRATQPKLATGSVMCAGYIRRIISAPQNSPSDPPEQPTCPASSSSWPSPPPRSPSPG